MDALVTKCWLCPEMARPKAKWASVLDENVAKSICRLLSLDTSSSTFLEFFTRADYCSSCQEFVLQIDFLMRTMHTKLNISDHCAMQAIQRKVFHCRTKLSRRILNNCDISSVGEICVQVQNDDTDTGFLSESEYEDMPYEKLPDVATTSRVHGNFSATVPIGTIPEQVSVTTEPELHVVTSPVPVVPVMEDSRCQGDYFAVNSGAQIQPRHLESHKQKFSPSKSEEPNRIFQSSMVTGRRQTRSLTKSIQNPIISYHQENSDNDSDSDVSMNGDSEFVTNLSDSASEDNESNRNQYEAKGKSSDSAILKLKHSLSTKSGTSTTNGAVSARTNRKRKAKIENKTSNNEAGQVELITTRNRKALRKNGTTKKSFRKTVHLSLEQRTPKDDGRFHCFHSNCQKNYLQIRDLRSHIYKWHTERTPEEDAKIRSFVCREPGCSFFTWTEFALQIHKQKIHLGDPRPYKCSMCTKDYTRWNDLTNHRVKLHRRKEFLCNICGREYCRKCELDLHMLNKHKDTEGLRCKVCHQKFFFKEDCDKHEEKHVPGGPLSLTCLVMACKKVFENQEALRQHVVESHYGAKRLFCEHCAATFPNSDRLKSHLKTHSGVFEFPCTDCEKRFRSKWLQQSHFETVHAVDKTIYPCKLCDKTFHCRSFLYKHNSWHKHGDNANKPLAKQKKMRQEDADD